MKNLTLHALSWASTRGQREDGQTVIEYALVAAVLSIGLLTVVLLFGQDAVTRASSKVTAFIP